MTTCHACPSRRYIILFYIKFRSYKDASTIVYVEYNRSKFDTDNQEIYKFSTF